MWKGQLLTLFTESKIPSINIIQMQQMQQPQPENRKRNLSNFAALSQSGNGNNDDQAALSPSIVRERRSISADNDFKIKF